MEIKKLGFLQALGVALYCLLIGLFFWQISNILPEPNPPLGPMIFLLLFSTSVLICGLIVFYKPYRLFFEGNLPAGRQGKKEAVQLVLYTALWLFCFLILTFLLMVIFK